MAKDKTSFTAYCDWKETFDSLPDDKAGQLIKHLFSYVNDENPQTDDILIKAVFAQIKATLKRDLKKWERKRDQNKENALKRWNKSNANVCERIKINANDAVSDSVIVSDSDNKSINNTEKVLAVYDTFIKEIKEGKHSMAIEQIYMRLKVKKGTLQKVLEDYKGQIIINEVIHKNTQEMLKHFSNFCNKQDEIGKLDEFKNVKRAGAL